MIDNFSRRILSWRVTARFEPASTVEALLEAGRSLGEADDQPTLLTDGGVENVNREVDELIESGLLHRVIAMTELNFSNSMIEAWWKSLKHQWLFLNSLDSVARVRSLVEFYVDEHNSNLPHTAFNGQAPNEMYFGSGEGVAADLATKRRRAREARLEENRAASCPVCEEGIAAA